MKVFDQTQQAVGIVAQESKRSVARLTEQAANALAARAMAGTAGVVMVDVSRLIAASAIGAESRLGRQHRIVGTRGHAVRPSKPTLTMPILIDRVIGPVLGVRTLCATSAPALTCDISGVRIEFIQRFYLATSASASLRQQERGLL